MCALPSLPGCLRLPLTPERLSRPVGSREGAKGKKRREEEKVDAAPAVWGVAGGRYTGSSSKPDSFPESARLSSDWTTRHR